MTRESHHQERLARWHQEHGPAVRGFLGAMVRQQDVADDLTQEVFRKALQAADRYEERGTSRAYLMRIADHLVRDRWRRNGREVNLDEQTWQQFEPTDDQSPPDLPLAQHESRQELQAALDCLSPEQRRVLMLRFFSQMDFSAIAETMESPLNTVLSHCRRGLIALRKRLLENAS